MDVFDCSFVVQAFPKRQVYLQSRRKLVWKDTIILTPRSFMREAPNCCGVLGHTEPNRPTERKHEVSKTNKSLQVRDSASILYLILPLSILNVLQEQWETVHHTNRHDGVTLLIVATFLCNDLHQRVQWDRVIGNIRLRTVHEVRNPTPQHGLMRHDNHRLRRSLQLKYHRLESIDDVHVTLSPTLHSSRLAYCGYR